MRKTHTKTNKHANAALSLTVAIGDREFDEVTGGKLLHGQACSDVSVVFQNDVCDKRKRDLLIPK